MTGVARLEASSAGWSPIWLHIVHGAFHSRNRPKGYKRPFSEGLSVGPPGL